MPRAKHGAHFAYTDYPWGTDYYLSNGAMAPADFIDQLRPADAILLGAVGHPNVPDNVTLNGLLLPIRRAFDQYANVRPASFTRASSRRWRCARARRSIWWWCARIPKASTRRWAASCTTNSRKKSPSRPPSSRAAACERVIRFAFELARKRNKKKRVTSITKSNAQGYSMVLWDRAFAKVAEEFPDIETESLLVDAAAMNFIRRPESFDVVVGSNLFGDILSDLSAIIVGSMGLAASANLDPSRRFPSMFEPVHGSAPDIAGKGIVNPAGHHPVRRADAGASGHAGRRAGDRRRGGGGSGGRQGPHAGSRRGQHHRTSDRRGDRCHALDG